MNTSVGGFRSTTPKRKENPSENTSINMQVHEQPSVQTSARLCEAIKWHPCLYDSKSKVYQMKHAVGAAWRSIANECEDTVANCKFRWRIIRKSFAASVRKNGPKSKHYLQDYLDFLLPHVSTIDPNDGNANTAGAGGSDVRPAEGTNNESNDDGEEDDEEEHLDDDDEEDDEDDYEENLDDEDENNSNDKSDMNDSDTTSAEETVKDKANEKGNKRKKTVARAEEDYDDDEQQSGRSTNDGSKQGRRITRARKATKRYVEFELYDGRRQDRQDEKRPRLSMERKKSVALEEDDKRKSITNFPNKKVEVKLVKTKLSEMASVPKKIKLDTPDKLKSVSADKIRTVHVKLDKSSVTNDIIAKPTATNTYTAVTETAKKPVNRGTQCDTEMPKTMDEEFLESIKPQMELMNSRQKFNFKKRVFQALMDVFDDATNFPNRDEIIDLPSTGAPRFDTTTVGELRLMRELVHMVQAAKSTPEIMNATEKVEPSGDNSPTPTPPTEKIAISNERKTNSPSIGNPRRSETLGLPRHILQKVVKVAGSNGGTILAHEGEKRRVYRIYPKGTLPSNVANTTTSTSASIGTFYVTPPKSSTASNTQSKTVASGGNSSTSKPIFLNSKPVNLLNDSTAITRSPVVQQSKSQAASNSSSSSSNTVARHKITVRTTQVPSGIVIQKPVSQSTSTSNSSPHVLQNKNVTSTNTAVSSQSKVAPTTIRTVQRVAWDDTQKPSTAGLSQIQISQPISLNATNNVKTFFEDTGKSANTATSPNSILPDGGLVEEEETAGTITTDNFDPLLIKTKIKDEPKE